MTFCGRILAVVATVGVTHFAAAAPPHEFSDEERAWWAVQTVADPAPPAAGHPVDAFIERKLAEAGLKPAPAAVAEELARRIYFDLVGLPPTPGQVHDFIGAYDSDADQAVASLVDELLASPRYGERWAQHWLDVVRYAESDGYREDAFRPDAHRYRDYVVSAFNDDKPYDQFVREQLAADEIAPNNPHVIEATGFLRLGVYEWNQRDAVSQREIMINEITSLTSEVFLGIGLGCARCHDHKFDPLLQRDYFALQAFLSSTAWPTGRRIGTSEQMVRLRRWEEQTSEIRSEMAELLAERDRKGRDKMVKMFPGDVQAMFRKPAAERSAFEEQIAMLVQRQVDREIAKTKPEKALEKQPEKLARYRELAEALAEFERAKPKLRPGFISTDTGVAAAPALMKKGSKMQEIPPAFPALLGAPTPKISPTANTTGRRRALAEWIASTENPLAARVAVNRIWQHHFGKGLAASPNDFGTLGEPPSHPELLDWLASRFSEGGWHIKPIHRLIMTSAAYRRTARAEPDESHDRVADADSLLWRYPPARLSAEQVRDAMLAVSGELRHRKQGGASAEGSEPVRSIYVKKRRNTPDGFLHCFDAPDGFDSAPDRQLTTTANQALLLTNNDWPMARARAFAKRLLGKGGKITPEAIANGYRLAWGREPCSDEVSLAQAFVSAQRDRFAKSVPAAPASNFPNENGLRPIAQNFAKVEGVELGNKGLWLQPGSRFEQLELGDVGLDADGFTIEAVVQLDAIHKDASVNTLASRWDGNQGHAGWAFGVTSEKSRYQPRNLILQLIGENPGGDLEYEVVASGLRVPLGRPVYIAAVVNPQPKGAGTAHFYLRDLSDPEAELQSAEISHNISGGLSDPATKWLVGGRDQKERSHLWDGQVGRLAIAAGTQPVSIPFSSTAKPVLDARFGAGEGGEPIPGTRWRKPGAPRAPASDPTLAAMADFCHALLGSNEFLYLH